jgi:hypothetical protein
MVSSAIARLACSPIPAGLSPLPIFSRHVQPHVGAKPMSRWLVVGSDGILATKLLNSVGNNAVGAGLAGGKA